jgi:hypothetical protein
MPAINEEHALVPLANLDLDRPLINTVFPLKGRSQKVWAPLVLLLILRVDCFIIQRFKFLERNVTNREHNDEGYFVQGLCLIYEKIWSF